MSELKPCPFCGSEVRRVQGLMGLNFFKCTSRKCGAVVSFDSDYYNAKPDKAIEAWNTRAEIQTQHTHCCPCGAERTCEIEEKLHEPSGMSFFWCSSCKTPSEVWFSYCPHCGAKVIGSSKFEQGSSSAKVVE